MEGLSLDFDDDVPSRAPANTGAAVTLSISSDTRRFFLRIIDLLVR